ncbi:Glucuronoyl esterase catalytic domain from Hypocrea Jecorina [Coprinopsis marcescibilis]|uniref:(4-O-methyl)-D-glucuronate--lignin esterase n=1 Tax=Coprinopsis marcescibilis TaxID=230819 RepID=A0A5C3KV86_COPMA|nr:Glucuronoyl esterase catalytic domain from Hypocrea Jecorina [Coprinopsis marcescibilis]
MTSLKSLLALVTLSVTVLAQTCAPLPATITLRANSRLPDPFTTYGGQKVTTAADWTCRRNEISELFQRLEVGTLPPKPSSVTGTVSGNSITVNVNNGGTGISFTASIRYPTGNGPFPAIIALGGASIPIPSNVAVITYNNDDIAQQANTGSRGRGKFYTLYGQGHSASAMTAWVWGVSRLIDVLEANTGHRIDTKRLGVTGCSRNGKGAIMIGAFEPRIALTIPQESGSGGAACWRLSDDMSRRGIEVQTARQIVTENVWFSPLFNQYVNRVPDLPLDHHFLAGLVAPRGLLVIEHSGINWLGPFSTYGCMVTGRKVYQALGVPNNMGISSVGGHGHCQFPSSQNTELTAFINKFLLNNTSANTNVQRSDVNLNYNEASWVDWTVPNLA